MRSLEFIDKIIKEKDIYLGLLTTFLLRFISFVFIYAINFIIAKLYGAGNLGIFTLINTILEIALVFSVIGLDTALLRFIPQILTQNKLYLNNFLRRIDKLIFILSVIVSLLLFFSRNIIANVLFKEENLAHFLGMLSFAFPFFVISRINSSKYRAIKLIKESIFFEIINIRFLILIVLFYTLFIQKTPFKIVMLSYFIIIIVNGLYSITDWNKKISRIYKKEKNKQQKEKGFSKDIIKYREIFSISTPMFFTSSMLLILGWTDTIMLGILTNTEVVGVYNVVLKLSWLTSFLFLSINTIMVPKYSELYWSGDIKRLASINNLSSMLIFWTSVPMLILIMWFSSPLLGVFGKNFEIGSVALIILCIGQFIRASAGNGVQLLNMTGYEKVARNILIITVVFNIFFNVLLIPFFGMNGAAIATAISTVIRDISAAVIAYKRLGFSTFYKPKLIWRWKNA
jgi:O-antigen/teichoic acid export membrane protein